MALETATYISDLVATNPTSTDPKSQGDDHLRLIKAAVKATFPNVTGAVTASHADINQLTGTTNLSAVAGLASAGLMTRTGPGTVAARVIVGGAGVTVTNADGVDGNPTISMSPTVGAGDMLGPPSAVDGNLVAFDGTSGKLLKDSGIPKPSGTIVGTTDTQTLTNKTLGSGSTWQGNAVGVAYGGTGANTLSGIVKGNGSSAFTAATPDTDYVTPSGTGTLYNKTFSGSCTWNGNAVGVAYGGTGVTSLTGMVKGNGTGAFSAAVAGTDYVAPSGALGTPASGNLSNCSVDGANEIGYRNIPQVSKSAAYALVLSDAGKHIYHPSADTTARTWTIPSNASVAYPIGTAITFVNDSSAGTITLAITSDTLVMSPSGSTGSRTLAANGVATAIKVTSTRWVISGTGLS